MAEVVQVRIGINLGATLQVDGFNFAKPSVFSDVVFDGVPTDEELYERWKWLWDRVIEPQADDLFEVIKARVRELPVTDTRPKAKLRPDDLPPGVPYS